MAAFIVLGALAVVVVGAVLLLTSKASLSADRVALAKVNLPTGGGKIEHVVVIGPRERAIPVYVQGDRIYPRGRIPAHEPVTIDVTVKRPGWVAWASGATQRLHIALVTPSARVRSHYLTLHSGQPLRLVFTQPVRVLAYGPPGHLHQRVLPSAQTRVTLPRSADAGTIEVSGAPRTWETAQATFVSWFPSGAAASAVSNPAPGTQIKPSTPITLTFNKTISAALGNSRPPVSPATSGSWHTLNSHTIEFLPEGYGYGLGASVNVQLPSGVRLVGGGQPITTSPSSSSSSSAYATTTPTSTTTAGTPNRGSWTVPPGSTLRLQQMLSLLGYLPLNFHYHGHGVGLNPAVQEAAAVNPPHGSFSWRYPNTPDALKGFWSPGSLGTVTKGALMAFQNDHGLTTDGVAGPAVWKALIAANITGHKSSFGYTFVTVSVASQSLTLWHSGKTILTTPVNTGIASAPTATGTYPVFSHLPVTTMSGTNPDGSHYSDPGIQYVSYFNGGDALHAFNRAQFGFPQSLGCVEMMTAPAGQVFPYTPIGTLVHVA